MSIRLKRIFTYLVTAAALTALYCVGVSAYSYPSMPSDISNLKVTVGNVTMPLSNYPDGSYFDREKCYMTVEEQKLFGLSVGEDIYLRGWQCVGFARYVYTALFYKYPQNATIDNYLAYESGSTSYGYTDMIQSVLGSETLPGGYSAATLKKLFTACRPGAVMRVGGHSMVLMAIYNDGFVIYDANFSSDNEVDVRAYTWQSFIDSRGSETILALHMPTYYPGYSYSTGSTGSSGNVNYTIDSSTAGTYIVTDCTSLNVRSAPMTSASKVGSLASGTAVEVAGSYNGWAQIVYGAAQCWISMDYLAGPQKEITVTFDPNGGKLTYSRKTYTTGAAFGTMPTATKTNRILLGWSDGTTLYTAVSTVPYVSSLKLTAMWGIGSFQDVSESSWYADYVETAYELNLINDGANFSPDDYTKRADFVTVLSRVYQNTTGKILSGTASKIFQDVSKGAYYDTAVAWAYGAGIATGKTNSTFDPGGYVTREQIATFLYRYAQYAGVLKGEYTGSSVIYDYKDGASVSNYAVSPMNWMVNIGLMKGDENGKLNPTTYAKRSEMITIIARFMDYLSE